MTEIYVKFLGRLCDFVMERGRIPMFWGDVLATNPEITEELPREAICLNWDYWPDSKEETTQRFVEAGVEHLYVCPGVQGWKNVIHNNSKGKENDSYAGTFHFTGI